MCICIRGFCHGGRILTIRGGFWPPAGILHVGEDSEDFRGDSEILVRISISGGDFDWIIIPLKIFTFSPWTFYHFPQQEFFFTWWGFWRWFPLFARNPMIGHFDTANNAPGKKEGEKVSVLRRSAARGQCRNLLNKNGREIQTVLKMINA